MDAPILYAYSPGTGELLGRAQADPDPEHEDGWLIPAFTTDVPPPSARSRQVAIFGAHGWRLMPDHRGETWYGLDGNAIVVERLGDPAEFAPPLATSKPSPSPPVVPDSPTLTDWRVGLTVWKGADGTLRIDEVTAKVAALVQAGHPMGRIARERLEYANTVQRAQLVQLADAFGFTADEIDQSLWRADRVRQGDLSGVWPLLPRG